MWHREFVKFFTSWLKRQVTNSGKWIQADHFWHCGAFAIGDRLLAISNLKSQIDASIDEFARNPVGRVP
jgi:hypothetical protein